MLRAKLTVGELSFDSLNRLRNDFDDLLQASKEFIESTRKSVNRGPHEAMMMAKLKELVEELSK